MNEYEKMREALTKVVKGYESPPAPKTIESEMLKAVWLLYSSVDMRPDDYHPNEAGNTPVLKARTFLVNCDYIPATIRDEIKPTIEAMNQANRRESVIELANSVIAHIDIIRNLNMHEGNSLR